MKYPKNTRSSFSIPDNTRLALYMMQIPVPNPYPNRPEIFFPIPDLYPTRSWKTLPVSPCFWQSDNTWINIQYCNQIDSIKMLPLIFLLLTTVTHIFFNIFTSVDSFVNTCINIFFTELWSNVLKLSLICLLKYILQRFMIHSVL